MAETQYSRGQTYHVCGHRRRNSRRSQWGNTTKHPKWAGCCTTTPDAGNKEVTVRIPQGSSELMRNAYTPNPVEVNVGDTVTWINDDITPHTATSGSSSSGSTGMFGGTDDSPEIIGPDGGRQSLTFDGRLCVQGRCTCIQTW